MKAQTIFHGDAARKNGVEAPDMERKTLPGVKERYWGLFGAALLALAGCTPPPPILTPTPATVAFGNVLVGTTKTSPPVTWQNVSQNNIDVVGFVGDTAFTVRVPVAFKSGTLRPSDKTTPVTFEFAPDKASNFNGTGAPLTTTFMTPAAKPVSLTGTGVFQIATGDLGVIVGGGGAGAIDFGSVVVPGGTPVEKRFEVINLGRTNRQVKATIVGGGNDFSVVRPASPFTLRAGQRVTVRIRFKPSKEGMLTGAVMFEDVTDPAKHNAGASLKGKGVKAGEGGD